MLKTNLVKKLGIQFPLIQAPMAGGATTPELVAAVSNSGGLGSLGAAYMPAEAIRKAIIKLRELTEKPFAVNLFIPNEHHASLAEIKSSCHFIEQACRELKIQIKPPTPPYAQSFEEQISVLLEEKVPIFSFIFGIPAQSLLDKFIRNKTILIGTATNVAEALELEQAAIDLIVAQGSEAGGHRGSFIGKAEDSLIGLISLLPQVISQLKTPVIAAGGIMNAKAIKVALELGASAVQMGTAFLTCKESGIHPHYKEALLATTADNTALTTAFSGKLARGIKNKFIERLAAAEEHILPYPIQNAMTRSLRNEAAKQNCIDFMSMWAGQSAYLCKEMTAAELMRELIAGLSSI
ncbi:MAG: nitronate monooxygenase [Tatlockia sp.]|nr:nitronate monooxygenase [Tatlockia sp.]